jgi:hypothetical protein
MSFRFPLSGSTPMWPADLVFGRARSRAYPAAPPRARMHRSFIGPIPTMAIAEIGVMRIAGRRRLLSPDAARYKRRGDVHCQGKARAPFPTGPCRTTRRTIA